MPATPDLTVIIPTFRDSTRLQICLDALGSQSLDCERFVIIVANNDPSDPLLGLSLPHNAQIITVATPGSYAARNAAIMLSDTDYLVFTDSDCIPEPQWLEAGMSALHQYGGRITGPVKIFREKGSSLTAYEYEFHTAFRIKEHAQAGRATTANLFVARKDFDRVGNFNEGLLSGGDFDWNNRATSCCLPINYEEAVAVGHPARSSLAALFAKRRRVARGEATYAQSTFYLKLKYLLKPPLKRITYDRGPAKVFTRLKIFALQWTMNIYALAQWTATRFGVVNQKRQ